VAVSLPIPQDWRSGLARSWGGVLLFLRRHSEARVTDGATALRIRVPTLREVVNDLVGQADLLDINTTSLSVLFFNSSLIIKHSPLMH
jgi:hypothetical protein